MYIMILSESFFPGIKQMRAVRQCVIPVPEVLARELLNPGPGSMNP